MNLQFSAKDFKSGAEIVANAAAVRRRLLSPSVRPRIASAPEIRSTLKPARYREYDAHVKAWQRWKASAGSPLKNYIVSRCDELGLSYEEMIGPRKTDEIARARHMLMWEIKTHVKPSISLPELGRLFGGRDHTTALHGVRRHTARLSGQP
ncbi:hypothetical protein KYK29_10320 [Shinella daejeonensis]|uniref:helix-turn-helix domain-containing protein n=1 Tax=Shinella daejeonensis TaxID=659017 RepID=UPI0020C7E1C3|nr:helix-turn-helix domain-containing protein [Shinella daejeonensis]MCP8895328.1 hypothetical protein [Shinella daejeonensis]